jgi:hypothetical protein
MRKFSKRAAFVGLVLAALSTEARADVVYTFIELNATVDGTAANAGAVGEIVLTDAGFASGAVSVSTEIGPIPPIYHLNGVVSASFGTPGPDFQGPIVGTGIGFDTTVDFTATVNGPFLDLDNGFIAAFAGTETYVIHGDPLSHLLTIQYANDNFGTNCSPNLSGEGLCFVTGFFVNLNSIPEPGSLSALSAALLAFAALGIARARKKSARND